MAVTFSQPAEYRSFSLGPIKAELFEAQAQSGDTSVVCTFDNLVEVHQAVITGCVCTAKSISGNVCTFTINDPLATVQLSIIGFGF